MSVKLPKSVQEQTDSVKILWTLFDPRVSETDCVVCNHFPKEAKRGRPIKQSRKTLGEQ